MKELFVNTDTYELPEEASQGKVLLDFYSKTCGPCKMVASELAKLDMELDFTLIKVDVEEFANIAGDYEVFSVPTLVFLNDNEEYKRTTGFITSKQIESHLK